MLVGRKLSEQRKVRRYQELMDYNALIFPLSALVEASKRGRAACPPNCAQCVLFVREGPPNSLKLRRHFQTVLTGYYILVLTPACRSPGGGGG